MSNYNDLNDGIKLYFNSVKQFTSLKKSEERLLLEDYRFNGNLAARDKLIKSNLKYACAIANSYRGKGVDFSELISEANRGLIESIDKYDLEKNVKIITYAKWWIIQRLNLYLTNAYKHKGNDLPTDHQEQYDDEHEQICSTTHQNKEYENLVADDIDTNAKKEEQKYILYRLLDKLDERERDMIELYYGINGEQLNLEEIGLNYNVTKERTRQIIESALKKIRSYALLIDKPIYF